MKKIYLATLFLGGGTIVPLMALSSSCLDNDKNFIEYNKNELSYPSLDGKTNLHDILDNADLNIFYAPGVQPYYDTIRLAMLAKGQVSFYYTPEVRSMDYHGVVNHNVFEDFLQNHRKNFGTSNAEKEAIDKLHKNSKLYKVDGESFPGTSWYAVPKMIKEDIKRNSNKKINIWVNNYHIKNRDWYSLTDFKNVNMIGLNDSSSVLRNWYKSFENIAKEYIDQNTKKLKKTPDSYSHEKYILMSNVIDNYHGFYNDAESVKKLQNLGVNINPYSYSKDYEIKNQLFDARDKDSKRLSVEWWPKITKMNWKTEIKKVKDLKAQNSKKSLIYLGSHGSFFEYEKNHILSLINKYADQYNIFYKGHPGTVITDNWIENSVNANQSLKYYDVFEKQEKTIKVTNDKKVTVLFNQIASEELTTNHRDDPYFEKFDKWASTHRHSSSLQGFLKTNQLEDLALAGDYPERPGKQYDFISGDDADKNTPAWIEFKKLIGYE